MNPASNLYEIFLQWRTHYETLSYPNQEVADSRRLQTFSEGNRSAWALQRQAVRCLDGIEAIINRMDEEGDDVSSEKAYFVEWCDAVFAFPDGWKTKGHGVSEQALASLGMFRNSAKRFVPDAGPDFLKELRALLEDEPSLTPPADRPYPAELYDYFTRVKFHLKDCIDNYEVTNSFDLYRAAEAYRAAVFMMVNGKFVTNPADWGRFAAKTYAFGFARRFGNKFFDEATNHLSRETIRALGGWGRKMIESPPIS